MGWDGADQRELADQPVHHHQRVRHPLAACDLALHGRLRRRGRLGLDGAVGWGYRDVATHIGKPSNSTERSAPEDGAPNTRSNPSPHTTGRHIGKPRSLDISDPHSQIAGGARLFAGERGKAWPY